MGCIGFLALVDISVQRARASAAVVDMPSPFVGRTALAFALDMVTIDIILSPKKGQLCAAILFFLHYPLSH